MQLGGSCIVICCLALLYNHLSPPRPIISSPFCSLNTPPPQTPKTLPEPEVTESGIAAEPPQVKSPVVSA